MGLSSSSGWQAVKEVNKIASAVRVRREIAENLCMKLCLKVKKLLKLVQQI